jgi:hypothetical protein
MYYTNVLYNSFVTLAIHPRPGEARVFLIMCDKILQK